MNRPKLTLPEGFSPRHLEYSYTYHRIKGDNGKLLRLANGSSPSDLLHLAENRMRGCVADLIADFAVKCVIYRNKVDNFKALEKLL